MARSAPPSRSSASSSPAHLDRRLAKQGRASWLLKRWLVLNIDPATAALAFAAGMSAPGALAAGAMALGLAAAVLGVWAAAASTAAPPAGPGAAAGVGGGRGPRRRGRLLIRIGDTVAARVRTGRPGAPFVVCCLLSASSCSNLSLPARSYVLLLAAAVCFPTLQA
jgi:hypothetical protein